MDFARAASGPSRVRGSPRMLAGCARAVWGSRLGPLSTRRAGLADIRVDAGIARLRVEDALRRAPLGLCRSMGSSGAVATSAGPTRGAEGRDAPDAAPPGTAGDAAPSVPPEAFARFPGGPVPEAHPRVPGSSLSSLPWTSLTHADLPFDASTDRSPRQVYRAAFARAGWERLRDPGEGAPVRERPDAPLELVGFPPPLDRSRFPPARLIAASAPVAVGLGIDLGELDSPRFLDLLTGDWGVLAQGREAWDRAEEEDEREEGRGGGGEGEGEGSVSTGVAGAGEVASADGPAAPPLPPPAPFPYAAVYGGHQFGSWAGQLGDGRAIVLGELPNAGWRETGAATASTAPPATWEVQVKGSGRTPFSRFADGRAVLRSSVREFVASEALAALGVPTTRALALALTGQPVERDPTYSGHRIWEQGAVVARAARSFLRFGSFQLPASRGDKEGVRAIADHAIRRLFPEIAGARSGGGTGAAGAAFGGSADAGASGGASKGSGDADVAEVASKGSGDADVAEVASKGSGDAAAAGAPSQAAVDGGASEAASTPAPPPVSNPYLAMACESARRAGRLVASWGRVGFVHGVLNTDNCSLVGDTIDYGPYGFLERYDPAFTPNTTDLPGRRYAFAAQPKAMAWNVAQFAYALELSGLLDEAESKEVLDVYVDAYYASLTAAAARKLGLADDVLARSDALYSDWLDVLRRRKLDYTNAFRALGEVYPPEGDADEAEEGGRIPPALLAQLRETEHIAEPEDEETDDEGGEGDSGGGNDEGKGGKGSGDVQGSAAAPARFADVSRWLARYRAALSESGHAAPYAELDERRRRANPRIVPRNHVMQDIVAACERGDDEPLRAYLCALARPYDEAREGEDPSWTQPAPPECRVGVELLSCSS